MEVTVKAVEEDFQGELKIVYGPIELDNLTKDKYNRAKNNRNFQIECTGKADNKIDFTLLCFEGDLLIAKNANLKEIKRMKIVGEMMVVTNSVYPNKLKVVLPALNSELAVEFDEVRDKDVALLLIEHKKKMVIDGKSEMLRTGGLGEDFRIEKKGDNEFMLGKGFGDNSLNDTFRDNLHSLTDLLKESKKENVMEPRRENGQVENKIVFKEVDSFQEMRARESQGQKPFNREGPSRDNLIGFNREGRRTGGGQNEEFKQACPPQKREAPLVLRNPYHSSANQRVLFKKSEENILDSLQEHRERKENEDMSRDLMDFDGMSEQEMDKMINKVFKKEKVKVHKYGRELRDSLEKERGKLRETDSFFEDVEISRDFHKLPVKTFQKKVKVERVEEQKGNIPTGFGMANKEEYKALYQKLRKEFDVEKDLELQRKMQEKEARNEKKIKRLVETQKGLMRELRLLREKREDSILMGEELEKEKEMGLHLQIKSLGDKYSEIKRKFDGEKREKEEKMKQLESTKSRLMEVENQNYDFKHSLEDKEKEIHLLKESTRFLEMKMSKIESEKEELIEDLNEKDELKNKVESLMEEVQRKDEEVRSMKMSLYEVEVNEKILQQQHEDEKQKARELKRKVEENVKEKVHIERELKMVNKHREDLDRELRMRKGAGLIEEERQRLEREVRQFQEFARKKDAEIEGLRGKVDDLKGERMRMEMFYKEKRNEKESLLENEIKDWERDAKRKDQKILDLEFERNICNRELEEKNKEIERLRADVEKYRKMEEEFLKTVQAMNEEQERESIRTQRTRELDETRDNLIRKLKRRLRNEETQNNLLQKTNDGLVGDVDRLRTEKLKYLDLVKGLKQRLATRTEQKERKKSDPFDVESDDSIDVGLMKNEQFMRKKVEESYERRFRNVENLNSIQSVEVKKEGRVEFRENFLETDKKEGKRLKLGISSNKGFMFKSNAASFKGLASGLVSDNIGVPLAKNDDLFEMKTEMAMKDKRINQLENVSNN